MRKDMMEMRRDMTNLSIEQRGRNQDIGNVTPNTQREYGNFTPCMVLMTFWHIACINFMMVVGILLEIENVED